MQLVKLLEPIPFFRDFTQQELQSIAGNDTFYMRFDKGEVIIQEGDVGDSSLYVVVKGSVSVSKFNMPIASLKPGAVIGEISFLTMRPRSTTVVAAEPTIMFRITSKTIKSLHKDTAEKIKDQLIDILISRLDEMNVALTKIVR
jgi:CRP-like cAMP-binding protein